MILKKNIWLIQEKQEETKNNFLIDFFRIIKFWKKRKKYNRYVFKK